MRPTVYVDAVATLILAVGFRPTMIPAAFVASIDGSVGVVTHVGFNGCRSRHRGIIRNQKERTMPLTTCMQISLDSLTNTPLSVSSISAILTSDIVANVVGDSQKLLRHDLASRKRPKRTVVPTFAAHNLSTRTDSDTQTAVVFEDFEVSPDSLSD